MPNSCTASRELRSQKSQKGDLDYLQTGEKTAPQYTKNSNVKFMGEIIWK